ncbi:coiled-coil domain-containing protein 102A isoform X2 [Phlebotomus argentipes]|uniref:coiled-coil domain-containing protein 102A isoform X2 n=1 Tax=Phlebotomus argentipes TaxID=94469 RepID=UPI0028934AF7|nr:coiled-coil domain-containing protein 102A isoform X2 [Phlebotomus argentipes]
MSQCNATAASLGAPPRRFRGETAPPQVSQMQAPDANGPISGGGVGTSQSARFGEAEWETKELQRQRELEEARARASQMEKTMKWWSDCTANWREKWSKVRTERNKARDEAKQLRSSLEAAIKESNSYKREKSELETQISQLKKEMERIHALLMKHAGQFDKNGLEAVDEPDRIGRDNDSPDVSSDGLKNVNSEDGLGAVSKLVDQGEYDDPSSTEERRLIQQLSKEEHDEEEYLQQKVSVLKMRLDEACKTLDRERDDKLGYQKSIERLSLEIQDVKAKCEELRISKQDAVRELLTLQEQHRAEVRISHNALQEEVNARESLERRLCELRGELERLQTENAVEWGKRERLDTEKLILERDNKRLRGELRDFQERVDRRTRPALPSGDLEVRNLQQELAEKNKEISELRHSHGKLKKLLAESNTELGHAGRRAEQYEGEVKRLRARVEELKRELFGVDKVGKTSLRSFRPLSFGLGDDADCERGPNGEGVRLDDDLHETCSHVKRHQRGNDDQHVNRHSSSPKQQSYYDSSYKPNINDLRQLFDDTKRKSDSRGYFPGKSQPHSMYYDEGVFEGRQQRSNMFDFERAKQKFDKNEKKMSGKGGGKKITESCSTELGISKQNFNETVQFFDENMRKKDAYMKTSLNLDGLKVSDDETP